MHSALAAICAAFASCAITTACADPVYVDSVAALTNAVKNATAGTTIVLRASGSPYRFTDEWMEVNGTATNLLAIAVDNVTIEGETATSRKTWTTGSEPVIIDGNGLGTIVKVDGASRYHATLKHLTFTRAFNGAARADAVKVADYTYVKCTNCVFRQNACSSMPTALNWGEMRDCLVTNNTGASGMYVLRNLNAYGCDIIDNHGCLWDAVQAYDCTITDNDTTVGDTELDVVLCNKGSRGRCERCVFKRNIAKRHIIAYLDVLKDCQFESNTTRGNYAIFNASVVTNCTFRRNVGEGLNSTIAENFTSIFKCDFMENQVCAGGMWLHKDGVDAVADGCTFVSNTLARRGQDGHGGAGIWVQRTPSTRCTMTVTNCTFAWNGAASGSYAYYIGGAICATNSVAGEEPWAAVAVSDCEFTSNCAYRAGGVCGALVRNCRFYGNDDNVANNFHGTAWLSRLEDCVIDGGGLVDCVVNRCHLYGGGENVSCLFGGYVRATNCLVERCVINFGFGSMYYIGPEFQMDADFVNCTFATNRMYTYRTGANCTVTNGVRFANCLFNGNYTPYISSDFSLVRLNNDSPHPEWMTNSTTFSSCFYGKFTAGSDLTAECFASMTNAPNTLAFCADPKFVKNSTPAAPYWSLSVRSPIRGRGDASIWTAEDVDLAGKLRIRDGGVDPGCYECWLHIPGMSISFR